MRAIIHYEPATRRERVALHAWEPAGKVWDIEARPDDQGRFTFELTGETIDPRVIRYKFRFPLEGEAWESDDYERGLPTRDESQEVWSFDFSRRQIRRDPYAAEAPERITFQVVTRERFNGGRLFAWDPRPGGAREFFDQKGRDDAAHVSEFEVPVREWMRRGFHFKLVAPGGENPWEPEWSNRVWRPVDGAEVWMKSGQVSLRERPLQTKQAPIDLIYPRSLTPPPQLVLKDLGEEYREVLQPLGTEPLDADFAVARYEAAVYADAVYVVHSIEREPPHSFYLPLRVMEDDPPRLAPSTALLGVYRWLDARPKRDARVRIVVHPNPRSQFPDTLDLELSVGAAPSDDRTARQRPFARVPASRQADGTWAAEVTVFADLPHSVRLLAADGTAEHPPEELVKSLRTFVLPSGGPTTVHTGDGLKGLARDGGPRFADVPIPQRRDLMASAYSRAIVEAGVFDPEEMPHGATIHDGDVWFAVHAPHAVTAQLLILTNEGRGSARAVAAHRMAVTDDLRYWWCRVPGSEAAHGARYRFLLNGSEEVLDPAARWLDDPGDLWPKNGEGIEGPWSRVVDPAVIRRHFDDSPWRTMGWEALLIYEMHPLRLTRRDRSGAGPRSAFDRVIQELAPGGYLQRLGVTALELMPVHEFPRDISWGYNPSGFFAVDTFYGGPEGLARAVRAAHDAGKGVMLDVVFNHMNDSALQQVARDVYVDGETNWGDMVNYDHPLAVEFFRQALIYLWQTFELDGFRFDATRAIINGHIHDGNILRIPGSGGGWSFMEALHRAQRRAADALGRPWPYLCGENDPTDFEISRPGKPPVLDGLWHFEFHYRLADAAWNTDDKAAEIRREMEYPHNLLRPFYEAVRYGESHDSCSHEQPWKRRIAQRPPWRQGRRMAKAVGAAALLSMGVPMLFMGQEAGEDTPFWFGMDALDMADRYLPLEEYEGGEVDAARVLAWHQDLMGLRNNPGNGLRGNDHQVVGWGRKTVAFTRAGGRFFVVATFGTPDTRQDSGWLGLPGGAAYKEIFNSSWPVFQVEFEPEAANGGYDGWITSGQILNLPSIGAVVLERR
jgi:1,4-alpha-glucan branching enzyme